VDQAGAVRGAEQPLERARERGLLQGGEDAAAVVVDHDQAQVGTRLVRAEGQARRVVQERQVPDQREGRAAVGQRGTDRRRGGAVDPAGTAAGQHAEVRSGRKGTINIPNGLA